MHALKTFAHLHDEWPPGYDACLRAERLRVEGGYL